MENELKHGAIRQPLRRGAKRLYRRAVGRRISGAAPFDWAKGYDVRDTIGSIAIKDQGQSSSCGGQAGAYFLEIQRRLQDFKEGAISAKSIYAPIAYRGGGTTISSLETEIGAHGAELEAAVPSYDANGNPLTESMMVEKSWVTPDVTKDMITRAGYTPYDIADDIDTVASTIEANGAVIWEIEGQNNGTWLSPYPEPPQSPAWSHFMCAIGAKTISGKNYIIALQSWGTRAGESGIQYFGEEYFKSGNIDAFAFIYDSKVSPLPSNQSIWAAIALWFKSQWRLAQSLSV